MNETPPKPTAPHLVTNDETLHFLHEQVHA